MNESYAVLANLFLTNIQLLNDKRIESGHHLRPSMFYFDVNFATFDRPTWNGDYKDSQLYAYVHFNMKLFENVA